MATLDQVRSGYTPVVETYIPKEKCENQKGRRLDKVNYDLDHQETHMKVVKIMIEALKDTKNPTVSNYWIKRLQSDREVVCQVFENLGKGMTVYFTSQKTPQLSAQIVFAGRIFIENMDHLNKLMETEDYEFRNSNKYRDYKPVNLAQLLWIIQEQELHYLRADNVMPGETESSKK